LIGFVAGGLIQSLLFRKWDGAPKKIDREGSLFIFRQRLAGVEQVDRFDTPILSPSGFSVQRQVHRCFTGLHVPQIMSRYLPNLNPTRCFRIASSRERTAPRLTAENLAVICKYPFGKTGDSSPGICRTRRHGFPSLAARCHC
jgi:hypothetical protein